MNKEKINQILKNQSTILLAIEPLVKDLDVLKSIDDRMGETLGLFLGQPKQPTITERTHDALSEETEVEK